MFHRSLCLAVDLASIPEIAYRFTRRLLFIALLSICLCGNVEADERISRPDEQLLILSVTIGALPLYDGVMTFWDGERLFIPLLEFMEVLEIPITGSIDEGVAEGWYRTENSRFLLNWERRMLNLNGRMQAPDWSGIELHETDFYVDSRLITEWFDLELEIQFNASRINIPPGQGLVLEQRLERETRWRRMGSRSETQSVGGDFVQYPREMLGWPAIDTRIEARADSAMPGQFGGANLDLIAMGDFFRTEGIFSLTLRDEPFQPALIDTRVRLQRELTFNPHITWQGGDIHTADFGILGPQLQGAGFRFGYLDEAQTIGLFRTTLRGEALNGWDVELYRNTELLAFTTVDTNNQYVFEDIPLNPGLNLLRFVFYGPQGQRRERDQQIVIDNETLPKGQQRWNFFGMIRNLSLLPQTINVEGFELEDDISNWAGGLSYRTSIGGRMEIGGDALSHVLLDGSRRFYVSPFLRTSIGSWLLEKRFFQDFTGGNGATFSARKFGISDSLTINYTYSNQFESEQFNQPESQSKVSDRVSARWTSNRIHQWPIALDLEHRQYERSEDGKSQRSTTGGFRVSHRWQDLAVGKSLQVRSNPELSDIVSGGWLLSYRRSRLDFTAQLGYRLWPDLDLSSANLTTSWRRDEKWTFRGNLNHSFDTNTATRVGFSVIRNGQRWIKSLNSNVTTDGRYQISFALSTSLHRPAESWELSAQSTANTYTVVAHVFLDKNGNGEFDAADEPLAGVRVSGGFGGKRVFTDETGKAIIEQLPSSQVVAVQIREDSLENPFWIPSTSVKRIRAHTGQTIVLSFPVMVSTEIDGTVYLHDDSGRRESSNVNLQLLDSHGKLVRELRSAFDGFYLFDQLPPGEYLLQVDPEQLKRLNLTSSPPIRVLLGGDEDELVTIDWVLSPAGQ